MNSVKIVEDFWEAVWKSRNPDAISDFVADDVILTSGGIDVAGKESFIAWAWQFLKKIDDFHFEVLETFQNTDGSRVASRWRFTGRNNGVLGTVADHKPLSCTGTAIWAVRHDGKLLHNWVERASWEMYQQLAA